MAAKGMNLTATRSLVSEEETIPLLVEYPEFSFRIPGKDELATSPKEGELCIYMEYFSKGLKLPVQDSLAVILNHFDMAPGQLTPNAFEVLLALEVFFQDQSIEWSIPNVLSLLTFGRKAGGFYCVMTRHSHEFGLAGLVSSIKGWRSNYVFVTSPGGWNVPTRGSTPGHDTFKWPQMTAPLIALYESLQGGNFILLDVEDWCYSVHPMAVKDRGDATTIGLGSGDVTVPSSQKGGLGGPTGKGGASSSYVPEESEEEDEEPLKKKRKSRNSAPTYTPVENVSSGSEKPSKSSSDNKEEEETSPDSAEQSKSEASDGHSSAATEDEGAEGPSHPEDKVTEDDPAVDGEVAGGVVPAQQQPEASPSRERRSKKKEEKRPLDDGYDADGYKFDKATRVTSFRQNRERDLLPQGEISFLPAKLLYGMTTEGDLQFLESQSPLEIFKRGCQLNAASSVYLANLYSRGDKLEKALHAKERANGALRKSQRLTEAELVKVQRDLKASEKRRKEVEKKTLEEIKSLRESLISAETHVDNEKTTNELHLSEIGRLTTALELERESHKKSTADSERLIESLKNLPAKEGCSLDEAEAVYKASDRYGDAMSDFSEHGFNLLKKALLESGRVDPSILNDFVYDDCI